MAVTILDSQKAQVGSLAEKYLAGLIEEGSKVIFPTFEEIASTLKEGDKVIIAKAAALNTVTTEISLELKDATLSPIQGNVWEVTAKIRGLATGIIVKNTETGEVYFPEKKEGVLLVSSMLNSDGTVSNKFLEEIKPRRELAVQSLREAFWSIVSRIHMFNKGKKYALEQKYDPIIQPIDETGEILSGLFSVLLQEMSARSSHTFGRSLGALHTSTIERLKAIKPKINEKDGNGVHFSILGLNQKMSKEMKGDDFFIMPGHPDKAFRLLGKMDDVNYRVQIIGLEKDKSGLPIVDTVSGDGMLGVSPTELLKYVLSYEDEIYDNAEAERRLSNMERYSSNDLNVALRKYNEIALAEWHRSLCVVYLDTINAYFKKNIY